MRMVLLVAACAGMLALSACNTVEGVGRDISSAGDTLANAADDAK